MKYFSYQAKITITVFKKVKIFSPGVGFLSRFFVGGVFCKIFPPGGHGFDHLKKVPGGMFALGIDYELAVYYCDSYNG